MLLIAVVLLDYVLQIIYRNLESLPISEWNLHMDMIVILQIFFHNTTCN